MSDRTLQPDEAEAAGSDTGGGVAGADNAGAGSVGPAPNPAPAVMPPAAALAARLVHDIISRMGSPYAHGGPPLTHDVLWRQVVRRLGFAPQPQAHIGRPVSPPVAPPTLPAHLAYPSPVGGPMVRVPLAPVTIPAFTSTALVPPPAPVLITLSRLSTGAAQASPFAPAPAPAPLPMPFAVRRPPRHEAPEAEEAPHEHAASRWTAYRTVVARTAPPSLPSSPGLDYVVTASLASELSRPLVQHADLLAREERVYDIPLVPHAPQPVEVQPSPSASPDFVSSSEPVQAAVPVAAQAQDRGRGRDVPHDVAQEEPAGFVGRLAYLINRVASALRPSPAPPTPADSPSIDVIDVAVQVPAPGQPPARPPAAASSLSVPPAPAVPPPPLPMPVLRPAPARREATGDGDLPTAPAPRLPGQARAPGESVTAVRTGAGSGVGVAGAGRGGEVHTAPAAGSPPLPEAEPAPATPEVATPPAPTASVSIPVPSTPPVGQATAATTTTTSLWGTLLARLTGTRRAAGEPHEPHEPHEPPAERPAPLSMPWARPARAGVKGLQDDLGGAAEPEQVMPAAPAVAGRPSPAEPQPALVEGPAPVEHAPAASAVPVPTPQAGTGAGVGADVTADVAGAGRGGEVHTAPAAGSPPLPEAEPAPATPEVATPPAPTASVSIPVSVPSTPPTSPAPPVGQVTAATTTTTSLWGTLLARLTGTRRAAGEPHEPHEPPAERPAPLSMPWARPVRREARSAEPGEAGEGLPVTQVPAGRPVARPLVQPAEPAPTPEPAPALPPAVMPDMQAGAEQVQDLRGTHAPPVQPVAQEAHTVPTVPETPSVSFVPEAPDGPLAPGAVQAADVVTVPGSGPTPDAGAGHTAREAGGAIESVAPGAVEGVAGAGDEAEGMVEGFGGAAGEHLIAAWQVLSDMAETIADAHTPLVNVEPAVAVVRPGLAGRLLSRLARALDTGTAGLPAGTSQMTLLHLLRRALPGVGTGAWGRAETEGAAAPRGAGAWDRVRTYTYAPDASGTPGVSGVYGLAGTGIDTGIDTGADTWGVSAALSPSPMPSMSPVPLPVARPGATAQRQVLTPGQPPTVAPSLASAATLGPLPVSVPVTARPLAVTRPATHMSSSLDSLLHEYFAAEGGANELAYTIQGMGLGAGVLNPPISMPLTSPYTVTALEYGGLTPYYQPAYDALSFGFQPPHVAHGAVLPAYPAQSEYTEHPAGAGPEAPSPVFSDIPMPPATPYRPAAPRYATFSVSEVAPARDRGHEPVHTWSVDLSAEKGAGSEAAAWAEVVSSSVEGASRGTGAPALALAGEERAGAVAGAARPPAEEPQPSQPDVDRLADQVYSIIRRRLVVERERHW